MKDRSLPLPAGSGERMEHIARSPSGLVEAPQRIGMKFRTDCRLERFEAVLLSLRRSGSDWTAEAQGLMGGSAFDDRPKRPTSISNRSGRGIKDLG